MHWRALFLTLPLAACAQTSTIPIAQDAFQITSSAAPICGAAGAQRVAVRQAAVEVIRRGGDRFIIAGAQGGSQVVGHTPLVVQSTGYGGGIIYGGAPMVAHGQGLVVRMFRDGDPAAANALSARAELGPNWAEIAKSTQLTCFD